ncbi:MAG: hypothetical protein ACKVT1_03105, partial [Dehalococcoidia bacterium]
RGHHMLTALFARAAGAYSEPLALVEVQATVAGAGITDLCLTFEGGRWALVEVELEPMRADDRLEAIEVAAAGLDIMPALVRLGLSGESPRTGWEAVSWLDVAEALDGDPDPLAQQFAEFVLRDVLGLGPVPLEQAIATNRLYALGGAAVRKRFGERVRYVNSASRPLQGKYRYIGTTFSLDDGEMEYWAGLVNETVPLGEHYHLMLASKQQRVERPGDHPRATGDWKWAHWTGAGRVVRPVTLEAYADLLTRLRP